MTVDLKPYDSDVADQVFSTLFCNMPDRGDGLMETPAASLQLVVSALEYVVWDVHGEDRDTIKDAIWIVERLRDEQKEREWKRNRAQNERG